LAQEHENTVKSLVSTGLKILCLEMGVRVRAPLRLLILETD
jgi:hypothetical protein